MKGKIKNFVKEHEEAIIVGITGSLLCGVSYVVGCNNTLKCITRGFERASEIDDSWVAPLWNAIEEVNKKK